MDMEYYRLRSFSITSHGICNLGDSVKYVNKIIYYIKLILQYKNF